MPFYREPIIPENVVRLTSHIYSWPSVVIGNSLAAALTAFVSDSYFVANESPNVPSYEKIDVLGLSLFKHSLYSRCLYHLALIGKVPVADKTALIRLSPSEDKFYIITKNSKPIKATYGNLRLFSLTNIEDLPFEVEKTTEYQETIDVFEIIGEQLKNPKDFSTKNRKFIFRDDLIYVHSRGFEDKNDDMTIRLFLMSFLGKRLKGDIQLKEKKLNSQVNLKTTTVGKITIGTMEDEKCIQDLLELYPLKVKNLIMETSNGTAR